MADLAQRLTDLYNSLSQFKADHYPSWQTGEIFNALLAEAKQQLPDDPVVQAVSPAEKGKTAPGLMGKDVVRMDAGTIKAIIDQVLRALGEGGPSIG